MVAEYNDGVLRIRVPVKEQAKPRRVGVSVGRGESASIETTASDADGEQAHREAMGAATP